MSWFYKKCNNINKSTNVKFNVVYESFYFLAKTFQKCEMFFQC